MTRDVSDDGSRAYRSDIHRGVLMDLRFTLLSVAHAIPRPYTSIVTFPRSSIVVVLYRLPSGIR